MTITMGDLVYELVDGYEHRFHDHALAVAATEVTLTEILRAAREKRAPRIAERRAL
jgi:hypothetical protein